MNAKDSETRNKAPTVGKKKHAQGDTALMLGVSPEVLVLVSYLQTVSQ